MQLYLESSGIQYNMDEIVVEGFTFEDFIFIEKLLNNVRFSIDEMEDYKSANQLRSKVKEILFHEKS
jgi:hypothetical protein